MKVPEPRLIEQTRGLDFGICIKSENAIAFLKFAMAEATK
jgi:hypothetical protein